MRFFRKMKLSKGCTMFWMLAINVFLISYYVLYVKFIRYYRDLRIPRDPIDYSKRELVDLLKNPGECEDEKCF
ncbi:hypothetical protein DPMN_062145 [Dreissena polymorpha]|uniref:Uncharacterized protein n=1 Tax=Dreissena polymorpha TaxID=45954 RepID=A0A9D4HJ18_DREPO|nr:hypothetical protein DPMN_062145 [Dreissena polymorpha]